MGQQDPHGKETRSSCRTMTKFLGKYPEKVTFFLDIDQAIQTRGVRKSMDWSSVNFRVL